MRRRAVRAARSAFLVASRRLVPALVVEHEAGLFVVPSEDHTIAPKLFLHGTRGDFVQLERACSVLSATGRDLQGRTFVDVGANLGTTSLAALRLHGFGRVVACEPNPQLARHLRATVALNGLDGQLTVVEAAVAGEPGRTGFQAGKREGGAYFSGAGSLHPFQSDTEIVEVDVVTLDLLCDRGVVDPKEVGLVWLDAQGSEGSILGAANQLAEARVPVVTAVRRSRLRRAGCLDQFREIVADRFSELVDLRTSSGPWRDERRPATDIDELLARARHSTEVLLLP